jgi:hypothetical protein
VSGEDPDLGNVKHGTDILTASFEGMCPRARGQDKGLSQGLSWLSFLSLVQLLFPSGFKQGDYEW